jgi:hypothetical protein
LARNLRRRRVGLIATYRQDAIDRIHPVRPLLVELTRRGSSGSNSAA